MFSLKIKQFSNWLYRRYRKRNCPNVIIRCKNDINWYKDKLQDLSNKLPNENDFIVSNLSDSQNIENLSIN